MTTPQPAKTARARGPRRLLTVLALLLIAALVIVFLVMPIGFGIAATSAPRQAVGAPPEGFDALTLPTADGEQLAAWYLPPRNGAVIVLLHGATNSREAMRPYADMLARHDFGVLALDLRGHGESEGQTNLFGWQGSQDVAAALAFLETQDDVVTVGGLGLSLGGEVLLGAASENPQLRAIVSEGATHRSTEEFYAVPSHNNPVSSFQPMITYTTVYVITGDTPTTSILHSIEAARTTAFLLIAAANTPDEVEFNTVFAAAAPDRAELWVIPDVGHTGGFAHDPAAYEQRVIDFLSAALLAG
jgi:pimeloyl-ACP methyl ester carboxylesterase